MKGSFFENVMFCVTGSPDLPYLLDQFFDFLVSYEEEAINKRTRQEDTERRTDKQTDRQTDRHRQKDNQTDRQSHTCTCRQRERHTHDVIRDVERKKERKTDT